MDVGELDEDGLFGYEEDVVVEEEEVALDGFEVRFEAGRLVPTDVGSAGDDLSAGEGAEDAGDDFEGRVFVVLLEAFVFSYVLAVSGQR